MNIILCEYADKKAYTAGNKARTDTLSILKSEGYKHIPLYRSKSNKVIVFFQLIVGSLRALFSAGRNDIVFIQYPYYPTVVNTILLSVLKLGRRMRKYKISLLLHDVVALRTENSDRIRREVSSFNDMNYIISHNESMTKILKEYGGKDNIFTLGPFDYLYKGNTVKTNEFGDYRVVIAGNLEPEKSQYIYYLKNIRNVDFNLYGINYSGESNSHVTYKGQFPPEELIPNLEGQFGLVWDGDSLETCSGNYGRYLKYNNPHKFSLYLAAGLPLVVWNESALAGYVEENNIGIVIGSLLELGGKLKMIKPEEYAEMRDNVLKIRKELISGSHLRTIVKNMKDMEG